MSPRAASRLAWTLCAISMALVAGTIVFTILDRNVPNQGEFGLLFDTLVAIALLAFPVVGALVVSRRPDNSIGWLFCAVGVAFGLSSLCYGWAVYTLFKNPGSLPGGDLSAWLASWLFVPPLFAIPPLLFLLFPDGRALTPRWRPAIWFVGAAVALTSVGTALNPGRLDEPPFRSIENPVGVDGAGSAFEVAAAVGFSSLFVGILLGTVSLVLRFRRARGDERHQLKWVAGAAALFAFACVLALTPFMPGDSDTFGQLLILLSFATIPIAAGVAILKYRLYEVDVVVNRTLVYLGLTATLVGAYLGSVLLLQLLLSPESDFAIAGSTLAVAALVRPARARIQELVNRRFYRRKYDAKQTLDGFGGRLRDEIDLEALGSELRGVVRETMQPTHVSLWIRTP